MPEELRAAFVAHGGVGDVSAAAIGLNGNDFLRIGFDRKLNLVEVGIVLAAEGRARKRSNFDISVGDGKGLVKEQEEEMTNGRKKGREKNEPTLAPGGSAGC